LGNVDFSQLSFTLKEAVGDAPAVLVKYGVFINTVIDFIIIAFAIFMVIKGMNKMKRKEEPAPLSEPTIKECPHCFTEISIKAVRCPNCTSELG
jgi:large conductance mechanosensitive channel